MVKSVKMWQWLSPETVRGTPSRQLPQCLTTAWSIFRGCRQSANSGSLEFNIRDWHSALIFAIQRKFRQFRPQTCSLSNKWNWGTTFWKKDERLKVFAGTAVKYISGDYSRSTIVDRSKSALGLRSNCVQSLSRIRVPRPTVQLFHSDDSQWSPIHPSVCLFCSGSLLAAVGPLHSLRQAFLDSQRYPPLRGSQLNWMISHPHNVFGSHSQDNTKRCEEEPLIKQEKSELFVSSQFIGSKNCNILSKIIFLLILDWPLHWTQFSSGQICKINWSAALTEFSVPR